jgi:hypothetical protein
VPDRVTHRLSRENPEPASNGSRPLRPILLSAMLAERQGASEAIALLGPDRRRHLILARPKAF